MGFNLAFKKLSRSACYLLPLTVGLLTILYQVAGYKEFKGLKL